MIALEQVVSADSYPPTSSAYRLGQLSAQLGEVCVPEAIFIMRHDQREFARGYRDYAGDTITTKQILGEVAQ